MTLEDVTMEHFPSCLPYFQRQIALVETVIVVYNLSHCV